MKIKDDLLEGSNISFKKTPNHGSAFKPSNLNTIVVHYTAGPTAISAVRTLTNPRAKASAHIVVERDGSITQLAPFDIVTWHAGRSSHEGRTGLNQYSIGIEIVNAGPLTKSGNSYRAWYGTAYKEEDVIEAVHPNETKPRFWQTYTEQQIETVTELCQLLIDTYNIKYIVGHEEIAPKRKKDPGPAFPLKKLRDKLLHTRRDEDEDEVLPESGKVMVSKLNIRSNPKSGSDKVAKPLQKNAIVKVLEEKEGWYKVSTEITGWVASKYINVE